MRYLWLWIGCLIVLAGLWSSASIAQAQTPPTDQVTEGARLYAENCAVCHGQTGEGRVGVQLAKDWPSIRPDLLVRSVIEEGVEGTAMPAWNQKYGGPLSDAEIDAIVAYILSWQSGPPQVWPTPTPMLVTTLVPPAGVSGDPNIGAQLYAQNCAVCHGPSGEGRVGVTLAKAWPSLHPDLTIQSIIKRGVPGSPMPTWGQENGGPLSDEDVENIVAYILTWSSTTPAAEETPVPGVGLSQTVVVWVSVGLVVLLAVLVGFGLARRKG